MHPYISVAEDIEYLAGWCTDDANPWSTYPQDDELRRGSVALRRLLVDQEMQHAWRACGFDRQPILTANRISVDPGVSPSHVVLAGGKSVSGLVVWVPDGGQEPNFPTQNHAFRLQDFVESPAIVAYGKAIKRRELIQYFANVKGGAHLALSTRGRKRAEELVKKIERLDVSIEVTNKGALPSELREIGRAVGRSEDCLRLAETIRRSPSGDVNGIAERDSSPSE